MGVHKQPEVCEVFFMPRDSVVATYKDRMPRTLEWCHLYDPEGEVAFWAELFQPSNRSGRNGGGSATWLSDELCGGFGSRFSLVGHVLSPEKIEDTIRHVTSTQDEVRERAKVAAVKLEKARRKKDRQRQRKAEKKKEEEEGEQRIRAEVEASKIAMAKAARIPAPQLHTFDWSAAGYGRDAKAAEAGDALSTASSSSD